ncbi:MAG: hypothetical protein ACE5GS_08850 [Kiloniellaceae bacterium]
MDRPTRAPVPKSAAPGRGALALGLGVILASEALLFVDVAARGGAVLPYQDLPPPAGALQAAGRWVAVNMTPICWTAFLFVLDGLLTRLDPVHGGSPARRRPVRFAVCYLTSIAVWLSMDWLNFAFMGAWSYHGLPEDLVHRYVGYFLAFGAISPAIFLSAEAYRRLGLDRARGAPLAVGPRLRALSVAAGLAFLAFVIIVRHPVGSLTLWLGWVLLLDPVNHRLGAPSLISDWARGRWGRTLALMAAGLTCGLLWEFWNYWAAAKWTYDLAFLGPLEHYRYFEMPWVGMLGFPPFALECWVVFQTLLLVLGKLGLRLAEDLPDQAAVL